MRKRQYLGGGINPSYKSSELEFGVLETMFFPFGIALDVFSAVLLVVGNKVLKQQVNLVKKNYTNFSTYFNLIFSYVIFIFEFSYKDGFFFLTTSIFILNHQ